MVMKVRKMWSHVVGHWNAFIVKIFFLDKEKEHRQRINMLKQWIL